MIQILTDSSCGISQEEAKRLGIDVIPLCITFGEETFRDGVDLFSEAFYRMLTEGGVLPHTSQPAPYEFEERFERARAEGTTLLVLPISSALSGTLQCARMVKENGGYDNVYLYDSRCTTLMLELLVREAAKRAETLSIEERNALIKEQPAYGNIICRCEMISEGEIIDAIRRPLGARSLDGVKRRTRAGMGRCQAGFCSPRTMEILAREVPLAMTEITKCGPGSEIVLGHNKEI